MTTCGLSVVMCRRRGMHPRLLGLFIGKFAAAALLVLLDLLPMVDTPDWLLPAATLLGMASGFGALWIRIGTVSEARLEGYRAARIDNQRQGHRTASISRLK